MSSCWFPNSFIFWLDHYVVTACEFRSRRHFHYFGLIEIHFWTSLPPVSCSWKFGSSPLVVNFDTLSTLCARTAAINCFKFACNRIHKLWNKIITVRKRSLRRLCFYTCLSFCPQGGVCLSACWDTHPLGQTSLRTDTPLGRHPPGRHPPGKTPPRQTPPCPVHAGMHTPAQCMLGYTVLSAFWDRHGYCCRQYASYWNVFLLRSMHLWQCLLLTFPW